MITEFDSTYNYLNKSGITNVTPELVSSFDALFKRFTIEDNPNDKYLFSIGFCLVNKKLSTLELNTAILLYFRNFSSEFNLAALNVICKHTIGSKNLKIKDVDSVVYRILQTASFKTKDAKGSVDEIRIMMVKEYLNGIMFIAFSGTVYPFVSSSLLLKLARDNGYDVYYESGYCEEKKDYYCYGIVSFDKVVLHERTLYLGEFKLKISSSGDSKPWKLFSTQMMSKKLIAFLLRDNVSQMMGLYEISERGDIEESENVKGRVTTSTNDGFVKSHKIFVKK